MLIPKISKIFRSPQLLLQYRRHADKISYREIAYFLGSGDLRRKTQIINQSIYSSIAQLVEHAAVNRRVVGSSPTGGAMIINPHI